MELDCGAYLGKRQLNPKDYLGKPKKKKELLALFSKYDIEIMTLSCHGNPISPDKRVAKKSYDVFVDTCKLAKQLKVKTVVTFSGCPAGSKNSRII